MSVTSGAGVVPSLAGAVTDMVQSTSDAVARANAVSRSQGFTRFKMSAEPAGVFGGAGGPWYSRSTLVALERYQAGK